MHFLYYKMKCELVNFPCCHVALLLYVFYVQLQETEIVYVTKLSIYLSFFQAENLPCHQEALLQNCLRPKMLVTSQRHSIPCVETLSNLKDVLGPSLGECLVLLDERRCPRDFSLVIVLSNYISQVFPLKLFRHIFHYCQMTATCRVKLVFPWILNLIYRYWVMLLC